MKLDPSIIEGKKPLTCFDIEEAKQFINHTGYVTDDATRFIDVDEITPRLLIDVRNDSGVCYKTNEGNCWRYFLPKEWVQEKEPEPEWKPYDLDSWRNDGFMIGSVITFRIKPKNNPDSKNTIVKSLVYLGDEEHSGDSNDIYIYIGTLGYSFQYLFENYEIFDNKYSDDNLCRWRPFGYQE